MVGFLGQRSRRVVRVSALGMVAIVATRWEHVGHIERQPAIFAEARHNGFGVPPVETYLWIWPEFPYASVHSMTEESPGARPLTRLFSEVILPAFYVLRAHYGSTGPYPELSLVLSPQQFQMYASTPWFELLNAVLQLKVVIAAEKAKDGDSFGGTNSLTHAVNLRGLGEDAAEHLSTSSGGSSLGGEIDLDSHINAPLVDAFRLRALGFFSIGRTTQVEEYQDGGNATSVFCNDVGNVVERRGVMEQCRCVGSLNEALLETSPRDALGKLSGASIFEAASADEIVLGLFTHPTCTMIVQRRSLLPSSVVRRWHFSLSGARIQHCMKTTQMGADDESFTLWDARRSMEGGTFVRSFETRNADVMQFMHCLACEVADFAHHKLPTGLLVGEPSEIGFHASWIRFLAEYIDVADTSRGTGRDDLGRLRDALVGMRDARRTPPDILIMTGGFGADTEIFDDVEAEWRPRFLLAGSRGVTPDLAAGGYRRLLSVCDRSEWHAKAHDGLTGEANATVVRTAERCLTLMELEYGCFLESLFELNCDDMLTSQAVFITDENVLESVIPGQPVVNSFQHLHAKLEHQTEGGRSAAAILSFRKYVSSSSHLDVNHQGEFGGGRVSRAKAVQHLHVTVVGDHVTAALEMVSVLKASISASEDDSPRPENPSPFPRVDLTLAGPICPRSAGEFHRNAHQCLLLSRVVGHSDSAQSSSLPGSAASGFRDRQISSDTHDAEVAFEDSDPFTRIMAHMISDDETAPYDIAEVGRALREVVDEDHDFSAVDLWLCAHPVALCIILGSILGGKAPLLIYGLSTILYGAPGMAASLVEGTNLRLAHSPSAHAYIELARAVLTAHANVLFLAEGLFCAAQTKAILELEKPPAILPPLALYIDDFYTFGGGIEKLKRAGPIWRGRISDTMKLRSLRRQEMQNQNMSRRREDSPRVVFLRSRFLLDSAQGQAYRRVVESSFLHSGMAAPLIVGHNARFIENRDLASKFHVAVLFPNDMEQRTFSELYRMGYPTYIPENEFLYRMQSYSPFGFASYGLLGVSEPERARVDAYLSGNISRDAEDESPWWESKGVNKDDPGRVIRLIELATFNTYPHILRFDSIAGLLGDLLNIPARVTTANGGLCLVERLHKAHRGMVIFYDALKARTLIDFREHLSRLRLV